MAVRGAVDDERLLRRVMLVLLGLSLVSTPRTMTAAATDVSTALVVVVMAVVATSLALLQLRLVAANVVATAIAVVAGAASLRVTWSMTQTVLAGETNVEALGMGLVAGVAAIVPLLAVGMRTRLAPVAIAIYTFAQVGVVLLAAGPSPGLDLLQANLRGLRSLAMVAAVTILLLLFADRRARSLEQAVSAAEQVDERRRVVAARDAVRARALELAASRVREPLRDLQRLSVPFDAAVAAGRSDTDPSRLVAAIRRVREAVEEVLEDLGSDGALGASAIAEGNVAADVVVPTARDIADDEALLRRLVFGVAAFGLVVLPLVSLTSEGRLGPVGLAVPIAVILLFVAAVHGGRITPGAVAPVLIVVPFALVMPSWWALAEDVAAGSVPVDRLGVGLIGSTMTVAGLALALVRPRPALAIGGAALAGSVLIAGVVDVELLSEAPTLLGIRLAVIGSALLWLVAEIGARRAQRIDEVAAATRAKAAELRAAQENAALQLEAHASVAHELRTPLQLLVGVAATLEARPDDVDPRLAGALSRAVARIGARFAALDASAHGDAHDDEALLPMSLGEVVDRALSVVADVVPGGRLHVAKQGDAFVRVDIDGMVHVLENLLANAVKYGDRGAPITLDAWTDATMAHVAVTSRGGDLTPDQAMQVFEPWVRGRGVDGSTPGTGLGLALVARTARRWGGEASCQVTDDGARFVVSVPTVRDPAHVYASKN